MPAVKRANRIIAHECLNNEESMVSMKNLQGGKINSN